MDTENTINPEGMVLRTEGLVKRYGRIHLPFT